MTKKGIFRSLASLGLLRLSESDLRSLHEVIGEMSTGSFIELIRDIEDEIDNSMALTLVRITEQASTSSDSTKLYHKLDQIRRMELRVPVHQFVDMLAESLSLVSTVESSQIPVFDPRRGLEAWIRKLGRTFSEQKVFLAAMHIRQEKSHSKGSDWKLR